jgi:hypothetical protein
VVGELVVGLVGVLIGNLEWYYNNTLNKLNKADKPNTTQYYVYDYQGKRVRTVVESNNQVQSQRAIGIKVILVVIFSATVAVWADGESLLPSATVCLVR